jgi:Zn-dependent oligopeptidase
MKITLSLALGAAIALTLAGCSKTDTNQVAAHKDKIRLNSKLFDLVKTLFEQRDTLELDPESYRLIEEKYKEDVRVFEVFEADGSTLAIFLMDPYARPSKRGGAEDAMTFFRNFRGADPDIQPLLERRGLN